MAESVDCDRPGHTSPNHKIAPIVDGILSKNSNRIIATFYSQNVFNIREFLDISKKYNRKVLFFDKEMQRIFFRSMDQGTFSIPQNLVLSHEDLLRPGNEDAVIILSGYGEKLLHMVERLASGETVNNLTIKESDTIIVASPTIPGLETIFTKSIDAIYRTGAQIINIKRRDVTSMHAHAEDIKMILTMLKPKYYMPVKGDFRHLVFNAQIAVDMNVGYNHGNTFVYDNGMVALFEDGMYKGNSAQIEVGEVMIDGLGVGDVGSYVLNDRAKLADNGVLILGITIDLKNKEIIAGPDVQQRGLFYVKDSERILNEITKLFEEMVNDQLRDNTIQKDESLTKIRDRIGMHIRRTTGKDPLIMPNIVII
jgi:ribonuclease J